MQDENPEPVLYDLLPQHCKSAVDLLTQHATHAVVKWYDAYGTLYTSDDYEPSFLTLDPVPILAFRFWCGPKTAYVWKTKAGWNLSPWWRCDSGRKRKAETAESFGQALDRLQELREAEEREFLYPWHRAEGITGQMARALAMVAKVVLALRARIAARLARTRWR